MDKVIRSFIVLFVLLIAITGYHKSMTNHIMHQLLTI